MMCYVYKTLYELDAKHYSKDNIDVWRKPDELRSKVSIKEGQIVLVPMAPLLNITTKKHSA